MRFTPALHDWVMTQAFALSSGQSKDSVGALAWNISVILSRLEDEGATFPAKFRGGDNCLSEGKQSALETREEKENPSQAGGGG